MTSEHEFGPPPDGSAPASATEPHDAEAAAEPVDEPSEEAAEADAATTLSPSVRRLVRQYDLDVTGIHGSGPSGRIRVGDMMGLLAGRGGSEQDRENSAAPEAAPGEALDEPTPTPYRAQTTDSAPAAGRAPAGAVQMTTVFECDLSRVLSHRKQRRQENAEALLTSYYVVACGEALKLVPEAAPTHDGPRLGVLLDSPDGIQRTALVDGADERARIDRRSPANRGSRAHADAPADLGSATLLIHQHGASGSLIATPTPIGHGHAASLGLGRVRREIVVRNVNGEEAPRVAARCYVSLSFYPDRLDLRRANRFLAQLVRVLEQWPD